MAYQFNEENVNGMYARLHKVVRAWQESGGDHLHRRPSRYGDVIEFTQPLVSVYANPWECVLLDPGRDTNPWLHHMEALWCLAGRNDVAFSARYAARMAEFSDDGTTRHGAYGWRWRKHWNEIPGGNYKAVDQLERCVQLLRKDPDDRRAVLTMWDPAADLGRVGKDLPCNTQVYLKLRQGRLIATVLCRSNDMVLGAYGANAVEFAFLMAYVAARLGVPLGEMTQVSDSAHVYTHPKHGKAWEEYPEPAPVVAYPGTWLLCDDPDVFVKEVEEFCAGGTGSWRNDFLGGTSLPMRTAWDEWKQRNLTGALQIAAEIDAPDWRFACLTWLKRRAERRLAKGEGL